MRIPATLLVVVLISTVSIAQNRMPVENSGPIGKANDINLTASLPLGEFSKYYSLGFGADYDRTFFTFGEIKRGKSYDYQSIRLNGNAGIDVLIGKHTTIGGIGVQYNNLTILHLFPEFEYNICERNEITLGLGPAFGLSKGDNNFGLGGNLSSTYFFDPQGNMLQRRGSMIDRYYGLGLGIDYYKLGDGDAVILGSLKLVMSL